MVKAKQKYFEGDLVSYRDKDYRIKNVYRMGSSFQYMLEGLKLLVKQEDL